MSNLGDGIIDGRRLDLLRLLVEEGGQGNDRTLTTAMRQIGHTQMLDQAHVRKLLGELADRGCVEAEMVRDTVLVARITERGRMAVAGFVSIGGVASPNMGL